MNARGKFAFVLFKPQSGGNIGAAARAIKNMGFDDLRLVAPDTSDFRAAEIMSVHADDVLANARTYADLESAVADCNITVGTTCRTGPYRSASRPVRDAALELAALDEGITVAIIFGPEDRGLTNSELKLCHRLLTIPSASQYPSLNLAQAVMVVAYELMMASREVSTSSATSELVTVADSDAMLNRMTEALVAIGFLPADNFDHIMLTLRELFTRSGIDGRECEILNGIARQMKWVAGGGYNILIEKRSAGRRVK
jgi:tRNA/rRNA methyltransferase